MSHTFFIPPEINRVSRKQPFFSELVPCGFPLPSEGIEDQPLDLHDYCVKRPASTFFIRCDGLSMIDAGIAPRDLLVVDCSIRPAHGAIVVARVDGEFTVKRLQLRPVPALLPMNPDFPIIEVDPELLEVFGVVTFSIRDCLHVPA
ncbi:translesion error-prone DNA polymerase V autoproteolytic subunit [Salmonella enterica]|nr:translesion error-prone DNA polymerase V autoproteolytic subunit [Salmonella enterica]EBU2945687.1 translesion error-prone DNA polymerase V autoproteolytic subunit [Salmonella enterica subsp. enterica]EBV4408245.1 peptidase [Salmonella enterica subsp. enterica serovar Baildon]EBX5571830.1 peptidase [Salmonella enterica subsp. enterica serovar Kuessel]EBZ2008262.1 peptidase [Salmonella enterica subsp. enterica serovar Newport]ECU9588097.1 peptidase [Salmonella enterica subsp. enterica serova